MPIYTTTLIVPAQLAHRYGEEFYTTQTRYAQPDPEAAVRAARIQAAEHYYHANGRRPDYMDFGLVNCIESTDARVVLDHWGDPRERGGATTVPR